MATDSQRCVDELLIKQNEIDQLVARIEDAKPDSSDSIEDITKQGQNLVLNTQGYIDNNKELIPAYCLKKTSDALRRLQAHLDKPKKANIQFKFKKPSIPPPEPSQESSTKKSKVEESLDDIPDYEDTEEEDSDDDELILEEEEIVRKPRKIVHYRESFGFSNRKNDFLTLRDDEVKDKDISLLNLDRCEVVIYGQANTVYLTNVWRSNIVICLATRAIKISDCYRCNLKLVCQQLRIDTSCAMIFNNYVAARTMFETSEDLEFKRLDLGTIDGMPREKVKELFEEAEFNEEENNWKLVDDFDHLSKTTPSKNFVIIE